MAVQVGKTEIEALGAKLEGFAKDLPKAERDVLGWVLQRAATSSGELSDADMEGVAGGLASPAGFQRPTSALLGRSLGFGGGDLAAFRIGVSWSW